MKPVIKFAALYGAYVIFLHVVDGPWKHWKEGREGQVLDPWTGQHVLWGAIGSYMGLGSGEVLILGTVNEVVEYGVRKFRPDLLWGTPETAGNMFADLAATWVGWQIGKRLTS